MPRHFKITVNGREYDVSVLELAPGETAPAPLAAVAVAGMTAAPVAPPTAAVTLNAASATPSEAGDVVAGMGGMVVEVHVNIGQAVVAGDRLLVLEAMKMKSPVIATHAGQVTRVLVSPKDTVEGGQVLVTIA